jgi:hypothetical protein
MEGRRKLHNEELPGLYPPPSVIGNIRSRKMRRVGHVVRIRVTFNVYM